MANIVLRNGKTLIYNEVEFMTVDGETMCLEGKKENLIAHIPLDIIERAEFENPCKIIYPKKKKK